MATNKSKPGKKSVKKPAVKAAPPAPAKSLVPQHGETPNDEQVAAQIQRLRDIVGKVVPTSIFGDNNVDAIEAQIEVLEDRFMLEEETYDKQDSGEWAENVASAAREAILWLDGESEQTDLAEGWPLRGRK